MPAPTSSPEPTFTNPRIKYIVAVASGKGGVGKSTTTAYLATGFAARGYKVGIMDADIYGPSIPHILHLEGKPKIDEQNRMIPHHSFGIYSNSMGYLIGSNTAASWRGPMASKALFQLFFQTAWPELDYLFIDMPPGTGDIQLSLASKIPVSCAVLVTTPQEISCLDVRKAADLFQKVKIPVVGIIENMSYFENPSSKERHYIFGKEGGKTLAKELDIPLIGQIAIDPNITQAMDIGKISTHVAFNTIIEQLEQILPARPPHAA